MLRDLTKRDWQKMLGLSDDQIPQALMLRGTRNLRHQYDQHRTHFDDVIEVGLPNGLIEDVFIGRLSGHLVAYASVYGAPMASEIVHLFGVLGTSLVIQTGCCGGLADEIVAGDLVLTTEAFCGDGAAHYYKRSGMTVRPTLNPGSFVPVAATGAAAVHLARMFTTSALFAEGEEEVEQWSAAGWGAVDMETATTLAVAEHFRMDSLAIHFVFDNPRRKEHILLSEPERFRRRAAGEEKTVKMALDIVRDYLQDPENRRRRSEGVALDRPLALSALSCDTAVSMTAGLPAHHSMPLVVREVRPDDTEAILRILNPIIESGAYSALDTPFSVEAEREFIHNFPQRGVFHVAEESREPGVVGFQTVEPFATYTRAFDHVGVVATFVEMACRGRGVGRRLAEATFEQARRKGYEKLFTFVRADNRDALRFYCGLGFRVVGTAARQARIGAKYVDEVIIETFL
jgi:L-amino acid N-acyltransferase YncA/uridine phosphorylase